MIRETRAVAALLLTALIGLGGCAGKKSILVPGQSEGDCDARAQKLGVCGTPKAVYENRDAIKHIYFEEDQAYRVSKNGKIYNIETGEEIIPGVAPDSCGLAVCPGCDDEDEAGRGSDASGKSAGCLGVNGEKDGILLQNRSLVLETEQTTTPIRDLGLIQKLWIAPHENRAGDLVMAHEIMVVVRKPSWIVGEEQPRRTKTGTVIPSPIATAILTDSHEAIDRKELGSLNDFVREEKPDLNIIRAFVDEGNGAEKVAPYQPKYNTIEE